MANFMLSSLESIFITVMYCFSSLYHFCSNISLKNPFVKFFICMKLSHLVMKWTSSSIEACLSGLLRSLHVLFSRLILSLFCLPLSISSLWSLNRSCSMPFCDLCHLPGLKYDSILNSVSCLL